MQSPTLRARHRVLCGVACVVGLASCGGDSASDDPSTAAESPSAKALSKAQVIERGDTACRDFRRRSDPLLEGIENLPLGQQADRLRRAADLSSETADTLDGLQAPPGDAATIERYVAKAREQLIVLRRAADSLGDGDTAEARALIDSSEETAAELRGLAQGYGFKVCGSPRD